MCVIFGIHALCLIVVRQTRTHASMRARHRDLRLVNCRYRISKIVYASHRPTFLAMVYPRLHDLKIKITSFHSPTFRYFSLSHLRHLHSSTMFRRTFLEGFPSFSLVGNHNPEIFGILHFRADRHRVREHLPLSYPLPSCVMLPQGISSVNTGTLLG